MFLKLGSDGSSPTLNILKTTELYTLRWVNFMVCESYLNTAIIK